MSQPHHALTPMILLALISGLQAQPLIFSEPENVLSISSNRWDNMPHVSNDGLRMYFSFDSPISQLGEIHMASRASLDEPFGQAVRLGGRPGKINFLGSLSQDELAIYYSSFTPPGGGKTVVQVARRAGLDQPFDFNNAQTLGFLNNVHGGSVQLGHVSNDGNTIYFNAFDGAEHHAYVAKRGNSGATFENATRIPVSGDDVLVEYVTEDELMMFSWNGGNSDMHMSSRSSVEEDFGSWVDLGTVVNSPEYDETFPYFHESTSTLFFASDRPGTIVPQEGRSPVVRDIWQAKASFPGDFDFDHSFTDADIDALAEAIRNGHYHFNLDTNHDGHVDMDDHLRWVHDSSFANTYYGDANLDGEFNSADLTLVFQSGEYEDKITLNSSWAEGDWNGDGDFGSGDLIAAFQDGGYGIGARAAVSAVPEPTCGMLLAIGAIVICRLRKR